MLSLELRPDVEHTPELHAFASVAQGHTTLEAVLRWAHAQTPPATLEDVVIQDEYTHDVIVRWGARFVVYGTT